MKRRGKRKSHFGLMVVVILGVVVLSLINKIDFGAAFALKPINVDRHENILLVNKKHKIGKGFVPDGLENITVRTANGISAEERQVSSKIMTSLESVFDAADKDEIKLYALSGYRSYTLQKNVYNYYLAKDGQNAKNTVALPGESEHQTGLALDITNSRRNFTGSREAEWVAANCYKYGFIVRYPKGKSDITGYSYESWHIRYVGMAAAKEIHNKQITLEEYLNEV